ncbi:MAG: CotH kinase family protein, partial [Solirubrobacterales bacterium]
ALSAATMYEPTTVVAIDLQLPQQSVEELEAEPDEYVEGTFALAETDGTPDGVGPLGAPITVGVLLKGGIGSFRNLDGKAAFKLKFNEFVKGQKFLGLKKLTLNNMVQDPSMLHETLSYEAFREVGVPAPHTGYAYVYVNGEDFGMHLNVETLDDVALEKRFGPLADGQHLYEGAYGTDVVPGGAASFEVDEGDEADRADLEALIADAAAPAPDFTTRMAAVADLGEMTRMWAAERYLGHWDGYSAPGVNNYYLYSDAAGRFQMLPWGTDQTVAAWWTPFSGPGGVLFEQCLDDEACAGAYVQALQGTRSAVAELSLTARAGVIAAQLAPWQGLEIEQLSRAPRSPEEVEDAVADVLHFLAVRPGLLDKWLGIEEAPAEPQPAPVAQPPAPDAPSYELSRRLEVDRSKLGRGVLLTRVETPAAGTVVQLGQIVTASGPLRACLAVATVETAGVATIRCRLSAAVRKHLDARRVVLRLRTGFEPDVGTGASFSTSVVIPRQG